MIRILTSFVLSAMLALPCAAQSTETDVVVASFLPGWQEADGSHVAGLRLTLAPGWKTYWRLPGDSGVPPSFAWTGSRNVKEAHVHWPHPEVFDDFGLQTIGYKNEVILPITLVPEDDATAVSVRGRAAIGVCNDVCLPIEFDFSATLPPTGQEGPAAAAIRAALALAPNGQSLRNAVVCRLTPIADGLRLTAEIAVPAQGGVEQVFMEPGRADIWVSQAEVHRSGGTLRASADLVPPDARPFALDRSAMRMTVLGRKGSIELEGCKAG